MLQNWVQFNESLGAISDELMNRFSNIVSDDIKDALLESWSICNFFDDNSSYHKSDKIFNNIRELCGLDWYINLEEFKKFSEDDIVGHGYDFFTKVKSGENVEDIKKYMSHWDSIQYFMKWPKHNEKHLVEIKEIIQEELIESSEILFGISDIYLGHDVLVDGSDWERKIPDEVYNVYMRYPCDTDVYKARGIVDDFASNLYVFGYSLVDIRTYTDRGDNNHCGISFTLYKS